MSVERILSWGAFATVLIYSLITNAQIDLNEVPVIGILASIVACVEYLNTVDHTKLIDQKHEEILERLVEQDKIIAENRAYISQVKMNKSLGRNV